MTTPERQKLTPEVSAPRWRSTNERRSAATVPFLIALAVLGAAAVAVVLRVRSRDGTLFAANRLPTHRPIIPGSMTQILDQVAAEVFAARPSLGAILGLSTECLATVQSERQYAAGAGVFAYPLVGEGSELSMARLEVHPITDQMGEWYKIHLSQASAHDQAEVEAPPWNLEMVFGFQGGTVAYVTALAQQSLHQTRELHDKLGKDGSRCVGGFYRITPQSTTWSPLVLAALVGQNGEPTWETTIGDARLLSAEALKDSEVESIYRILREYRGTAGQ